MLQPDKRRKVLHYRHAVVLPKHSHLTSLSLQARLTRILTDELSTVSSRCYFPDKDEGEYGCVERDAHIAISYADTSDEMLCIELIYIEPGTSVPVISRVDYDTDVLNYEALDLQTSDANREYLESIAFIGIINNHVILLQSKTIRIKDVEEYLNVLLHKTSHLDSSDYLVLQAGNSSFDSNSLRHNKVKSVKLSIPFSSGGLTPEREGAYDILKVLIGNNRAFDFNKLQSVSDDGRDLLLDVSIGYKYSTSDGNHEALREITQHLLDSRDESLTIELKGAGRIIGDEVQLKNQIYLLYSHSLPVRDCVFEGMIDWLISLLDDGMVNP